MSLPKPIARRGGLSSCPRPADHCDPVAAHHRHPAPARATSSRDAPTQAPRTPAVPTAHASQAGARPGTTPTRHDRYTGRRGTDHRAHAHPARPRPDATRPGRRAPTHGRCTWPAPSTHVPRPDALRPYPTAPAGAPPTPEHETGHAGHGGSEGTTPSTTAPVPPSPPWCRPAGPPAGGAGYPSSPMPPGTSGTTTTTARSSEDQSTKHATCQPQVAPRTASSHDDQHRCSRYNDRHNDACMNMRCVDLQLYTHDDGPHGDD